jgi:two-component system cell cycle sensor histidine kinase/response regulator CckA
MSETWRILLVEDSETDAKLVLAELRRSGKAIEALRVQDEPSMRAALSSQRWDMVVSDWSLPGFDGLLALSVMNELKLDLPFILVSGTVGEEMAVEAMRAGASDYVLKDRMIRLLPAVEREIRESRMRAAHRGAERALKRSEEQLRQAMKMEAVGRLAAGVAHDFNNTLSVILGYCELLLGRLHQADPIRQDIAEIDAAASRAADLTRQLLLFSRQHMLEPVKLDLNEVLSTLDKMLYRVVGEDIQLDLRLAHELCPIKVDRGSLEQVIVNLVVNARDAMPRGGMLTIETSREELDEEYARTHLGVKPGAYVRLNVSDTGIGMDEQTLARIFEPFFTTKDVNKGTGLGLATALGFVQQSGGSIWVYSEQGLGSTFKIYLPCGDGSGSATRTTSDRPLPRGSETILLVEDEAAVRTVASRILRAHGYQVLEANGPDEAVLICESHPGEIDLLLTDVVMPKRSGPLLAKELCAQRPLMKVLFMSGYTDDSVLRHGILHDEVVYLQKPITTTNLTRKVREALAHESVIGAPR